MEKIEVAVDGIRTVQPFPPHEVVVTLRTIAGQDVSLHIRPKEFRLLLGRLSDIAKEFPAETNGQENG